MVTDGHGIDVHTVHELHFELPLEEIEIGGTLKHIPTLEDEDILSPLLFYDALDESLPTGIAALAGIEGIGLGEGVDMAMDIVGVQNGETFLTARPYGTRGERGQRGRHGRHHQSDTTKTLEEFATGNI